MATERRRGRRQRICSWCSQSFYKDEHLARHVRTHTKERPFACTVCRKAFSRHDSLLRHSRSHSSSTVADNASGEIQTGSIIEDSTGSHGLRSSTWAHTDLVDAPQFEQSHENMSVMGELNPNGGDLSLPPTELIGQSDLCDTFTASQGVSGARSSEQATWGVQGADDPGQWESSLGPQPPGWLISDDFDLDMFNFCILDSASNWRPRPDDPVGTQPMSDLDQQPSADPTQLKREDLVHQHWFTSLVPSTTGSITPDVEPEESRVNEEYRESLVHKLQQRLPSFPLPSTDVMMYFTKFNPVFPIVHAPTFRPSAKSSLLLLSICSVGSLFIGSRRAVSQGQKIFEMLNKAILTSWERYIARGGKEAISMVQAALIGQTFGLLSGRPNDLMVVETCHGAIIAWARKYKMFRANPTPLESIRKEAALNVEKARDSWIQNEKNNRMATGLCIHDAEISGLLIADPFLRLSTANLPSVAEDDLWTASSATEWHQVIESHISASQTAYDKTSEASAQPANCQPKQKSGFGQYLELQLISSNIMEDWKRSSPRPTDYMEPLCNFNNQYLQANNQTANNFSLPVLWHSVCISLFVDINRLELAVGKAGHEQAQFNRSYAQDWACSIAGHRCALHAALILRHLESTTLVTEPAIHVPRVAFHAALVWFSYCEFGRGGSGVLPATAEAHFPELNGLRPTCQRLLFEANSFKSVRPNVDECRTLYALIDILERIGHWGISHKFATILRVMVSDTTALS